MGFASQNVSSTVSQLRPYLRRFNCLAEAFLIFANLLILFLVSCIPTENSWFPIFSHLVEQLAGSKVDHTNTVWYGKKKKNVNSRCWEGRYGHTYKNTNAVVWVLTQLLLHTHIKHTRAHTHIHTRCKQTPKYWYHAQKLTASLVHYLDTR